MNPYALFILSRQRSAAKSVLALQVAGVSISTVLAFLITMLAFALWNLPTGEVGYRVLGVALFCLLLVPLISLGTTSVRLCLRGRDDRLATLRLLGISSRTIGYVAVAEAVFIATCGIVIGVAFSTALPWTLSHLALQGSVLLTSQLWLPWWISIAIPPFLIAISVFSSLLGLRQITESPLGVRTHQDSPRLSWIRLLVAAVVFGVGLVIAHFSSPSWGVTALIAVAALCAVAVMGVLGLVGPLIVAFVAGRLVRRTSVPSTLIAMRAVLEDPKEAWRSVSSLALATFIIIPAGSLLGYLDAISKSESRRFMTGEQLQFFVDARTILVILAILSFVLVACQSTFTQVGGVIEDRSLYCSLDTIGVPRTALLAIRRKRVHVCALVASLLSGCVITTLIFPLVMVTAVTAPLFIVGIVGIEATGFLLLAFSMRATTPVLTYVLSAPARVE